MLRLLILLFCLAFFSAHQAHAGEKINVEGKAPTAIKWQQWSDDIFNQSKSQNKLVILDLHAVWCHWCHVMDEKTYGNPAVQKMIAEHFIPVSVDQDSRPDLANRYEDYGWPATIIFSPQGKERKLLQGFLAPDEFLPILQECVKDPNKLSTELAQSKEKFGQTSALAPELKKDLSSRFDEAYDTKAGGWTYGQKFLPRENVEYSMLLAFRGDKVAEKRAREVLQLQTNLLDPVWGGMYQYSTDDDWKHPHFEKIMEVQAGNMRAYSMAYLLWSNPEDLRVAEKIADYLFLFLRSPDGAFYTSQDADVVPGKHSSHYFALADKARRKVGVPRVDTHIYARENGWVVDALTCLYAASGDKKYLQAAEKAAKWIVDNRMQGDHFSHDSQKASQSFLADNLSMGRALLSLYAVTGDRAYLQQAERAADYMSKTFAATPDGSGAAPSGAGAGFVTVVPASAAGNALNLDENIAVARFSNLLNRYSGRDADKQSASVAMRYIATPWVTKKRSGIVGGILLADSEVNSEPPHIVIVGSKSDKLVQELFLETQKYPLAYKQTEIFDKKEGKLRDDDDYPDLPKPAAFTCSGGACSAPVYSVEALKTALARLGK